MAQCFYQFDTESLEGKKNKYIPGESKFRGADQIIKKLQYLQESEPEVPFTVCYMDRFLGILETDLQEYIQSSEIPFHRIQMFKRQGEVVWDRKKKFTTL